MGRVRRRLPLVAAIWLMCQGLAVALSPVALRADAVARGAVCTCSDAGPNHTCPMHHRDRQADSARCTIRSAHASLDAAFLAFIGGVGVMPANGALLLVPP